MPPRGRKRKREEEGELISRNRLVGKGLRTDPYNCSEYSESSAPAKAPPPARATKKKKPAGKKPPRPLEEYAQDEGRDGAK